MTFSYRPATLADAAYLAPRLRHNDRREMVDQYGVDNVLALLDQSIRCSETVEAIIVNGEVSALIGLQPNARPIAEIPNPNALIWLVGSPALTTSPLAFARESRDTLRRMTSHLRAVWNHVDPRYAAAIRWLEFLGFRPTGRALRVARSPTPYREMQYEPEQCHGRPTDCTLGR